MLDLEDQERLRVAREEARFKPPGTLTMFATPYSQKLNSFTVICTIYNRTIGSGIYVVPAIVLEATGSVGISLILWAAGAIISICALLLWLDMALGVPKFELKQRDESGNEVSEDLTWQAVSRNGGEKNYLEYVYDFPRMRTSCLYGMLYVTLGNLAGNAIQFGRFLLQAIYPSNVEGQVLTEHAEAKARGLAIACISFACLLHCVWRKGGIYVIDIVAILKVLILLAIISIGFAASAGQKFTLQFTDPPSHEHRPVHGGTIDPVLGTWSPNFSTQSSFSYAHHNVVDYAGAILFIVYTYSGYEQPFYVLSEVRRPKKKFTKATLFAMGSVTVLFMLVNAAYLCAVTFNDRFRSTCSENGGYCAHDMATVFFTDVFGNEKAPRIMAGIIALSIFGNNVVMTFTAARVKQELAKEGVIPGYRFFRADVRTPWSYLPPWLGGWKESDDPEAGPEKTPAPAMFLHFMFAMILIGATSGTSTSTAYKLLVSLYSYGIIVIVGFFVAFGLLWLRFRASRFYFNWFSHSLSMSHPLREPREWHSDSGINPWISLTAASFYAIVTGFLFVVVWIPPNNASPFKYDVPWYVVPVTCIGTVLLGGLYYEGLTRFYAPCCKGNRRFYPERDSKIIFDGEYIQGWEEIKVSWLSTQSPPPSNTPANGHVPGDIPLQDMPSQQEQSNDEPEVM